MELQQACRDIITNYVRQLPSREGEFLERVYRSGVEKYRNRLQRYGVSGKRRVLDAGCGYGQWTLALSELNAAVDAVDISPLRVQMLKEMIEAGGINNLQATVSGLEKLPFPDESFDAIFCYGVIFLTDWKASLRELCRVLAPEGQLILCANDIGWYWFLWDKEHNKCPGYDPRKIVADTFQATWHYQNHGEKIAGDIIITPEEMTQALEQHSCEVLECAKEGWLNAVEREGENFLLGEYAGRMAVYEIMAQKHW